MSEIIYNKNKDELYQYAVSVIRDFINKQLVSKEYVVLGIAGGRSAAGVFGLLKYELDIRWDRVHLFMVDERLVPLDDEDSNFRLVKEEFIDSLIEKGILPEENVHPFIPDEKGTDAGVLRYETELKKYGGVYDFMLLSAGEDGHIASLFPRHSSIKDESDYFLIVKDSPKPPRGRMTLSRNLLLKSKGVVILFIDEQKRQAYKDFMDNNPDYYSCPAKLVLSIKESYIVTNINDG